MRNIFKISDEEKVNTILEFIQGFWAVWFILFLLLLYGWWVNASRATKLENGGYQLCDELKKSNHALDADKCYSSWKDTVDQNSSITDPNADSWSN